MWSLKYVVSAHDIVRHVGIIIRLRDSVVWCVDGVRRRGIERRYIRESYIIRGVVHIIRSRFFQRLSPHARDPIYAIPCCHSVKPGQPHLRMYDDDTIARRLSSQGIKNK
jgi:hypothetical protein